MILRRFLTWFFLAVVLVAAGCSAELRPVTQYGNMAFVQIPSGRSETEALTDWLSVNPGQRITSMTSVLSDETHCGFLLSTEAGDNGGLHFTRIDVPEAVPVDSTAHTYYPFVFNKIVDWEEEHPGSQIVALATAPVVDSKVKAFILCYQR